MKKTDFREDEILEQARAQGLERLDQIKYAVLERDGFISVILKQGGLISAAYLNGWLA